MQKMDTKQSKGGTSQTRNSCIFSIKLFTHTIIMLIIKICNEETVKKEKHFQSFDAHCILT